jgi:hypothetical protein
VKKLSAVSPQPKTISDFSPLPRKGLIPDRVLESELWIIVGFQSQERDLPQYTGDFLLEGKVEAIKLANS